MACACIRGCGPLVFKRAARFYSIDLKKKAIRWFSQARFLCRCLCRNPPAQGSKFVQIPAHCARSLAGVFARKSRPARNLRSLLLFVAESAGRIRNDEVVGSSPTSSTSPHWASRCSVPLDLRGAPQIPILARSPSKGRRPEMKRFHLQNCGCIVLVSNVSGARNEQRRNHQPSPK